MLADADRSPSWRSPGTAGSRRTPGRTASACWPTCTWRPASVAGRSSSSRTTRPAGPPNGATSCSPSRSGPDRTGSCACRRRPGSGSCLDEAAVRAVRGVTTRRPAAPSRRPRTGSRAPRRSTPRTELFIDGRVRAGGVGPDLRRHRRPRRHADRARSPRAVPRTSTGRSPPPGASFDDRRWGDQPPMARKRVLLRLAELVREHLEELALLESLDVGKPIRDALNGRRPERRDDPPVVRRDDRQGLRRDRPDRTRRAVAGDPRADRRGRRDRALELPADHHGLEAGRRARDRQFGRAQARQPVAADRAAACRAGRRGRPARRRPQRRHRSGRRDRRRPGAPPGRRQDRLHRVHRGRQVAACARSARSDVKAISLELGGKSPQVVLADVGDLEAAASAIGWGIFYNSGQTCNAGSRLVVHRSVREELVERIAALGRQARARRAARSRGRGSARSSTTASSPRSSATWTRPAGGRDGRLGRRAGPRGHRRLLRRADDPRRRRRTRCGSRARRSSGRS